MGGDTGGNDCVHVIDVRVDHAAMRTLGEPDDFLSTTDVVIHDEHGNVCQFTYQEWHAFRLKMADGTFDHVGDYVSPEDIVSIKIDLSGVDPNATGMDPSAMARLDALPNVSGTISGTFSAAERDQTVYAVLGTFIPHTAEATGTPEHLRAVAEELERRDAATLALGVATVKAPECESCAGTGYSGDSATPNGGCWDCRGTGLHNSGELTPDPFDQPPGRPVPPMVADENETWMFDGENGR